MFEAPESKKARGEPVVEGMEEEDPLDAYMKKIEVGVLSVDIMFRPKQKPI